MQALEKSKNVEKTKYPVFKVENGCLDSSFSQNEGSLASNDVPPAEMSLSDVKQDDGVEDSFLQMSMSGGRPSGYFEASRTFTFDDSENTDSSHKLSSSRSKLSSSQRFLGATMDELGLDPEKSFETLQAEEREAKTKFADLLTQFETSMAQVEKGEELSAGGHSDSFEKVQKRYLDTVEQLRPSEFQPDKYRGPAQDAFTSLKKDYAQEATKKEKFVDLQDRWYDYDGAAQDNRWYEWCATAEEQSAVPSRDPRERENENKIDEKEEEIAIQWLDFTEMVVERAEKIKAESDDDLSIDEDMSRWREEARRFKADTATRKERKKNMLERRRKRRENAVKRHKEYVQQGGGGSRRRERDDARRETEVNSRRREEEEIRRRGDQEENSSEAGDSDEEEEESMQPEVDEADSTLAHEEKNESDGAKGTPKESTEKKDTEKKKEKESKKKKKVSKKDKKEQKDSKEVKSKKSKKDKDKEPPTTIITKEIEVKSSGGNSDISSTRPCGDDDDLTDGPEEKHPRHLDGTPWKNLLNFWTNKPKKINETGAKYIFKTLPRTDCFRRTERSGNDNASFYWFKADGDFDVIVRIKGNFRSSYDKAGIMLRENEKTWVLSGIEYFNGELNHSTCITRGISDWSLSPVPAEAKDGLWICVKRTEGKVECYFSLDVRRWVQTRQGLFTEAKTIKVGIAAACPMGEPFKVVFERFRVKNK